MLHREEERAPSEGGACSIGRRAGFRTHSSVIRFDNFVVTPKAKDASAVAPLSFPEATTPRIYDMQGLPMPIGKPLPHGIYIVNGKKMAY